MIAIHGARSESDTACPRTAAQETCGRACGNVRAMSSRPVYIRYLQYSHELKIFLRREYELLLYCWAHMLTLASMSVNSRHTYLPRNISDRPLTYQGAALRWQTRRVPTYLSLFHTLQACVEGCRGDVLFADTFDMSRDIGQESLQNRGGGPQHVQCGSRTSEYARL
jgi:hypothetical protein